MKLIYIGDHFYMESGTMMSPIYTEDGYRSDWGHVQTALKRGDSIEIRQATPQERDFYEARLAEMKREAEDRVARGVTTRHNNQVQAAPCLQGVAPATPS